MIGFDELPGLAVVPTYIQNIYAFKDESMNQYLKCKYKLENNSDAKLQSMLLVLGHIVNDADYTQMFWLS